MNRLFDITILIILIMFACNAQRNDDDMEAPPQYLGAITVEIPDISDSLECKRAEFDSLANEVSLMLWQRPARKPRIIATNPVREILKDTLK